MEQREIYLIMQADRDKIKEARRILSRRNKHTTWEDIKYHAEAATVYADSSRTDAIRDCRRINRKGLNYMHFHTTIKLY